MLAATNNKLNNAIRLNNMKIKTEEEDITRKLVSSDFIYSNIDYLFPDSVLLNGHFKILTASTSILHSLGYACNEICGQSVSCLEASGELEDVIKQRLQAGYFTDVLIKLNKKWGGTLTYSISGFYLGLLADNSSHIVLRFTNKDEVEELDRKLLQTKTQVDKFIYRAAHDLRGPLATIKGLVNLLKIRDNNTDVDRLLPLIDSHAATLDERLYQLLYIAESEVGYEEPTYNVDFTDLETHLRRVIEKNAFLDFLELTVTAPPGATPGYNEVYLRAIMTNLLLHLLSLPKSNTDCLIGVHAEVSRNYLNINIKANGFIADNEIQRNFEDFGASYPDLLRYSKLTHFFAAQKIASKLKAIVNVDFITDDCQQISITIPPNAR